MPLLEKRAASVAHSAQLAQ